MVSSSRIENCINTWKVLNVSLRCLYRDCSTRLNVRLMDYISFMAFRQIMHVSLSSFLCEEVQNSYKRMYFIGCFVGM